MRPDHFFLPLVQFAEVRSTNNFFLCLFGVPANLTGPDGTYGQLVH